MSTDLPTAERLRLGGKYADMLIRLGGTFPSEPMFERIEGALAFTERMAARVEAERDEPGGLGDVGAAWLASNDISIHGYDPQRQARATVPNAT